MEDNYSSLQRREALQEHYLKAYSEIILKYCPEAVPPTNKFAKDYDFYVKTKDSNSRRGGRNEFAHRVRTMLEPFLGSVVASELENELNAVSIDLSKDL